VLTVLYPTTHFKCMPTSSTQAAPLAWSFLYLVHPPPPRRLLDCLAVCAVESIAATAGMHPAPPPDLGARFNLLSCVLGGLLPAVGVGADSADSELVEALLPLDAEGRAASMLADTLQAVIEVRGE